MESSLLEHRRQASHLSLGSSHQSIYSKALELMGRFTQGGPHLDFGSGQGAFLNLLQKEFPRRPFAGMDLMAKPQGFPAELDWLQGDLNESLSLESETFESISALEIIEHLENPRHVFRELYRVLKPQGILILSTPNNESWRAILSYVKRGHFVAFTERDYPAHITALNRKDLLRSAQEAGFDFVAWDYTGEGRLPGLTRWSWQGLSLGLLNGLRYSDNIFIVLQKAA